jgi:hypothetical protein
VPYLDFEAAVPKTLEYFSDDVHLRKPANAILAKIAADAIDAARLIDASQPVTGDAPQTSRKHKS